MQKGRGKRLKVGEILKDRIGQLPEDVLCILFYHLMLKEAVRTSILSQRWKTLWKLTPRFCFDGSERMKRMLDCRLQFLCEERDLFERAKIEYIRWVNQVVDNHQGLDLEELMVVFCLDGRDSLHLDKWIGFALRKKVKAIKIDLIPGYYEFKNRARYSFLRSAHVTPGIDCLASLSLKHVDITGEAVENLLSVCPLLEHLNLENSDDLLNLRVVGSSLKLKYLSVMSCHKLTSLEIYAPNLASFRHQSLKTLQVRGLCCLVDLFINSTDYMYSLVEFSNFFQFWHHFPQLKTLKLVFFCPGFDKLLGLPQLTNLKHLTIKIKRLFGFYKCFSKYINLCPLLHKFTLELDSWVFDENFRVISARTGILCAHQYLKVVEMIGSIGRYYTIDIANFFLETVTNLKTLIINTSGNLFKTDENEVRMSTDNVAPHLREIVEELKREAPPEVELLIL